MNRNRSVIAVDLTGNEVLEKLGGKFETFYGKDVFRLEQLVLAVQDIGNNRLDGRALYNYVTIVSTGYQVDRADLTPATAAKQFKLAVKKVKDLLN